MARTLQLTLPSPARGAVAALAPAASSLRPPPQRPAPGPARARPRASGTCHPPQRPRRPLPAGGPGLPGRPPRPGRGLSRGFPDSPIHGSGRPSPSHRRGRRLTGARTRRSGPRHPRRARRQPRARAPRRSVERQVSCPRAHQPAGGEARARLRVNESLEASGGRTRPGSLLVGAVVRGVAAGGPAPVHRIAGGPPAHLACRGWLAAARPHRNRRATTRSVRPGPVVIETEMSAAGAAR